MGLGRPHTTVSRHASLLLATGAVAAATAVTGLSGCASSDEGAGPKETVTSTKTVAPEHTAGPSASAPPSASRTPSQTSKPPAQSPARDAASTVEAYFAAINSRDFQRAWDLGGKNLESSYGSFVSGFEGTARDSVQIVDVNGGTVTVNLDAEQTDGSVRSFAGSYTVANGVITSASIQAVGTTGPGEEGTTGPEEEDTTGPEETSGPEETTGPGEEDTTEPGDGGPYYEKCADAWEDRAAPIEQGEPGYADHLDRDKDGTACEREEGENESESETATPEP